MLGSGYELISEYLSRDSAGERLSASSWFEAHQSWPEDPGFDASVVVSRYQSIRHDSGASRATELVQFFVVGEVEAAGDYLSFRKSERIDTVTYVATRDSNGWRLAAPRLAPHISVEAALTKMNLDSASRAHLERLRRAK